MKRLHQACGTVLTGDALADAVLDYARALSNRKLTDVVDIPVVDDHGERGQARILIGWGIQLMSVTVPSLTSELEDQDAVDAIVRATTDTRAVHARAFGRMEPGNVDEFAYSPSPFEL